MVGACTELLTCIFCSRLLVVPFRCVFRFSPSYSRYSLCCSLDCRHAGCFNCVLDGFNNNGTSCPKCNAFCGNPPQYDVSLENFLSLVCSRTGTQHLTAGSSSIDPKTFEKLYGQRNTMTMLQAAGPQLQPLLSIAPQDQ